MVEGERRRFAPEFLQEIRERVPLFEQVITRVRLARKGGVWMGLCPFHNEKTPSFAVYEADHHYYCFGCRKRGDIFDWRQHVTSAAFVDIVHELAHMAGLAQTGPQLQERAIRKEARAHALARAETEKIEAADKHWQRTIPIAGTPAERYLRRTRGIRIPLPPTLRAGRNVKHPDGGYWWAMVGRVWNVGGAGVAIHRTYLREASPGRWEKVNHGRTKLMLGPCWRNALRLTPAEDVMLLAEGIETALSVMQAHWDDGAGCPQIDGEIVGVWAVLSEGNFAAVELPDTVREVIICADADNKDTALGEEAVDKAVAFHEKQKRLVRVAYPPPMKDFNSMLPPGAGRAVEAVADV